MLLINALVTIIVEKGTTIHTVAVACTGKPSKNHHSAWSLFAVGHNLLG